MANPSIVFKDLILSSKTHTDYPHAAYPWCKVWARCRVDIRGVDGVYMGLNGYYVEVVVVVAAVVRL